MPITIRVGLKEDGTRHMFGGVRGDGEGGGEVGEVKDGFGEEKAFEGVEGGLARRGPVLGEVLLGKVEEGTSDVGVVGNESTVEVGEPEERANIFHLGWRRPICNAVEFDGIHGQLAGFYDHAEVFYFVGGESTFFELQVKVELSHALQNAFSVFFVEGGVGRVDEEIVHVDDEPSLGNHIAEGVVHETLEGGGGVGEPEEHHCRFEQSLVSNNGRFPLVTVFDSYVVVSPSDVELREDFGISQFVYEI